MVLTPKRARPKPPSQPHSPQKRPTNTRTRDIKMVENSQVQSTCVHRSDVKRWLDLFDDELSPKTYWKGTRFLNG